MSDENKKVELSEEQLEKVIGGIGAEQTSEPYRRERPTHYERNPSVKIGHSLKDRKAEVELRPGRIKTLM